jgi:UDP-N-acetylmuramoylalanine--D-glutamate ligase
MVNEFAGQRIVILGLARQGTALARYLVERGGDVVLSDLRSAGELREEIDRLADLSLEVVLGSHPASLLDGADLLCLSGGVPVDAPIVRQAVARGIPLSNDSQIFLEACPAEVIGITGSAGKTTTTALTGEIGKAAGRRTWVGGNIGRPLIADLADIQPADLVVMELSSFQLEIMTRSTGVAAILNLTPNHLDRHKRMEVYTAAKARILTYQGEESVAVLGQDDPGSWALRSRVSGRLRSFSLHEPVSDGAFLRGDDIMLRGLDSERRVCGVSDLRLPGQHNVLNVLAATCLADSVGIPEECIANATRTFRGVEHRLELVRVVNGARWYNDSMATAPERMIAALSSFAEPIILLAGGRDKDLPWEQAIALIRERVRDIVLFGEAGDLIQGYLSACVQGGRLERIVQVSRLDEAVDEAAQLARPGDVVLLSPGGTSFDAYRDFAERGEHFRELVESV